MRIVPFVSLALPATLSLIGCVGSTTAPAKSKQLVVQQPSAIIPLAPMPPPPTRAELVPPPPSGALANVWQPGHWRYSGIAGSPWSWDSGNYVAVPPGANAWVPGQWQQRDSGFVWREGHWT